MIAFFENVSHFEILEHSKKWFFLGTHFFQVVKPVISFFFANSFIKIQVFLLFKFSSNGEFSPEMFRIFLT
jgi:hypothetical protein